jgi:beta-glucanase (GH16 family)
LRQVTAAEAILDVSMVDWHTYSIEWSKQAAIFTVDDVVVLTAQDPPNGPLGFVLWIDNQFAVASPLKGFHFGTTLTKQKEWLEVKILELSHS